MPMQIHKCVKIANTPAKKKKKNHKTISGNLGERRVFEERVRCDIAFSVSVCCRLLSVQRDISLLEM